MRGAGPWPLETPAGQLNNVHQSGELRWPRCSEWLMPAFHFSLAAVGALQSATQACRSCTGLLTFYGVHQGDTPLHWAADMGDVKLARLLLEWRADPDAQSEARIPDPLCAEG